MAKLHLLDAYVGRGIGKELVVAQGDHGIYAGGAAGGNPAGYGRCGDEDDSYGCECCGVPWAYAEQDATQERCR